MALDFETAHAMYANEIRMLARRQHVPGLDEDDVANEMLIVLWRACDTYQPASATSFGAYWWSMWLNRRSDISGAHYARKRIRAIPVSTMPERAYMDPMPLDPPTSDPVEALVWRLLAAGESGAEVRMLTELSKRGYYSLIEGWRNEDVRERLID